MLISDQLSKDAADAYYCAGRAFGFSGLMKLAPNAYEMIARSIPREGLSFFAQGVCSTVPIVRETLHEQIATREVCHHTPNA